MTILYSSKMRLYQDTTEEHVIASIFGNSKLLVSYAQEWKVVSTGAVAQATSKFGDEIPRTIVFHNGQFMGRGINRACAIDTNYIYGYTLRATVNLGRAETLAYAVYYDGRYRLITAHAPMLKKELSAPGKRYIEKRAKSVPSGTMDAILMYKKSTSADPNANFFVACQFPFTISPSGDIDVFNNDSPLEEMDENVPSSRLHFFTQGYHLDLSVANAFIGKRTNEMYRLVDDALDGWSNIAVRILRLFQFIYADWEAVERYISRTGEHLNLQIVLNHLGTLMRWDQRRTAHLLSQHVKTLNYLMNVACLCDDCVPTGQMYLEEERACTFAAQSRKKSWRTLCTYLLDQNDADMYGIVTGKYCKRDDVYAQYWAALAAYRSALADNLLGEIEQIAASSFAKVLC